MTATSIECPSCREPIEVPFTVSTSREPALTLTLSVDADTVIRRHVAKMHPEFGGDIGGKL